MGVEQIVQNKMSAGLGAGGTGASASSYLLNTSAGAMDPLAGSALGHGWGLGQWLLATPLVMAGAGLGLLVLLVLAVRSWWGSKSDYNRWRRDTSQQHQPDMAEDQLTALTATVLAAIESQQCLQRLLCEAGALARDQKLTHSLLKVVQKVMPKNIQSSMNVLVASAQGRIQCINFHCGSLPTHPH